ncbi:hypothetical protein [Actinophytocola sediminis]
MSDKVDADHERMVELFRVDIPVFSGDVTRVAPERGCAEGVLDCASLIRTEQAVTDRLHRFLTHLAQGISGYQQMVRDAARTYADGADRSRQELTTLVKEQITTAGAYDPRSNLPEYAPGFDRPAPAPQAP